MFTATQTYSDGEVVSWSDPTMEGQDEPEHPAPVLSLAAAGETDGASESGSDSHSDSVARALGIAGVALGAAGLAMGLSARQARRRDA